MPQIPDLTDPRHLDEIGWFLYHEKYRRDSFGGSYDEERLAYSRVLMEEVLLYCEHDAHWLESKTVLSIGAGCTGDLATWPAAIKIAVDPLLYVYQKLGMLLDDIPGTKPTLYLSSGVEDLPLLDQCIDLVLCRNSLDHMLDPATGLEQIARLLKDGGLLFVSVDIGGAPTPDEPNVFSVESLQDLLAKDFEILKFSSGHESHSGWRDCNARIVGRKKKTVHQTLDKQEILEAYISRIEPPEP
jgi:SAM-dependent methyltransferase